MTLFSHKYIVLTRSRKRQVSLLHGTCVDVLLVSAKRKAQAPLRQFQKTDRSSTEFYVGIFYRISTEQDKNSESTYVYKNGFLKPVSETWRFIEKLDEGQSQRKKMISVSLKPSSQPYRAVLILQVFDKGKTNTKVMYLAFEIRRA